MTIHHYTETAAPDATKRYPSDLNDQEFDLIAPHGVRKAGSGKKRSADIREVLNAIFYPIRTGCQWRMLPSDFPAWFHIWYYYRKWRNDGTLQRINTLLRREVRIQTDRGPEPSVAIIDRAQVRYFIYTASIIRGYDVSRSCLASIVESGRGWTELI